MTEVYLQYLNDRAIEAAKHKTPYAIPRSLDDLIDLGARVTEATEHESLLSELCELEFEDIEEFYEVDNVNE